MAGQVVVPVVLARSHKLTTTSSDRCALLVITNSYAGIAGYGGYLLNTHGDQFDGNAETLTSVFTLRTMI